jgi:hypothetical protein
MGRAVLAKRYRPFSFWGLPLTSCLRQGYGKAGEDSVAATQALTRIGQLPLPRCYLADEKKKICK